MSKEITNLLASRFVARTDVKAIQFSSGKWAPHTDTGKRDGERLPWTRPDFDSHLAGERTFGHYLLSADGECKLFAFDIDLREAGVLPRQDFFAHEEPAFAEEPNLRAAWLNRAHVGRSYMKHDFRRSAHKLMAVMTALQVPSACAYSGSKGVHVYGFLPKRLTADRAREGAMIVLEEAGYELEKGDNFFSHPDHVNLSVELFPKQGSLDGKDLGNLMRLPLGRNQKAPKEPTFFLDMSAPMAEFKPLDPVKALTMENPWQ